ncbi:hypothetical protein RB653_005609 [Dictyostelium firmibasis]|uniref:Radical SAM core domain-containing protein n=1 Tax=Dictyostelium firmibasis TaxID=79012 RepID=A0AAN7Z189_9MYCE
MINSNKIINKFLGYNNIKELPISLFVYWPYCSRICPYCNFNKYRDTVNVDHERMSNSLSRELQSFVNNFYRDNDEMSIIDRPITSIYFGGGTPSLAKISTFVETIETMRRLFPKLRIEDIEVTLEVNPDQKDLKNLLKDFKKYVGVNRVSLGVQSLIDSDLEYLGRSHTAKQAAESITLAKELFDHVTFDLIYSRNSKQTKEQWRNELKDALTLSQGNGHLSLYSLTFEEGTSFFKRLSLKDSNRLKIIPPNNELASDLYDITLEETERFGFAQYEVSSFASSNSQKGKHNQNYWRSGDFIGIGPGSSSRITTTNDNHEISRYSFRNILHPKDWMAKIQSDLTKPPCNAFIEDVVQHGKTNPSSTMKPLTNIEVAEEILLNGLRTVEGVQHSTFTFQTNGLTFDKFLNMNQIESFEKQGLLTFDPTCLKLTKNGIMLLDSIIPKILK